MKKLPLLVGLLILRAAAALADPPGQAPNFSGRIEAGAALVSTTDQLFARGDRRFDSLREEADRSSTVLPVALFDLRYRTASGREFYLGTPLESTTPRLSLGAATPLGRLGTLETSALASPWAELWKDPYLAGARRSATRAPEYGGRAAWTDVAGTGFAVSYTLLRTDVARDEAGERLPALRRTGWTHEAELGWRTPFGPRASLTPAFAATQGDLRGEAEAFRRYEAKLKAQLIQERYVLTALLSAGQTQYRAEHPVFGERRRERTANAAAIVTVPNLLGSPRMFANLVGFYGVRAAEIDFFDARTALAAATLGYSF
jgi:hypothetical protein